MKISITALDSRFSLYIRNRDGWRCQFPTCGVYYKPPTNGLHCAHMFSRRHYGTRFNEKNCTSLCYGHHSYIDSHPIEKIEFFTKLIGKEMFKYLHFKSTRYYKKADEMFK